MKKLTLLLAAVLLLIACESRSGAEKRMKEQQKEGRIIIVVERSFTSLSLIKVHEHLYLREEGATPLHLVSCPCFKN